MSSRFLSLAVVLALTAGASPGATPQRPRLVVLISVDQFRADYVQHYGHHWTRGLRQLLDRGAVFSQAAYPYMNTVTCAGHASMSTGSVPAAHGMVLNEWWDRTTGAAVKCAFDPSVTNISHVATPARGNDGPGRLLVPTLSDEMRLQSHGRSRVVSMSLKPRSAVTLAGRKATLATWFDNQRGFVTSTAYATGPVPFLQAFQQKHPVEADAGRVWERSLPADAYLFVDAGLGEESENTAWTSTFPHVLAGTPGTPGPQFYEMWKDSPFADEYLGRLAAGAVEEFGLGKGPDVDFLAISFSTLDEVGHDFGPSSHEVQDILVRLDATVGRLLDDLDRLVGRDHYVLAFTSDHGVPPLPPQVVEGGLAAGRLNGKDLVDRVHAALTPFFGEGPHVETLIYSELYFKPGVYARLQQAPAAMRAVIEAIEGTPGVLRALRSETLQDPAGSSDPVVRAARLSHVPGRSGDLSVIPRPFFISSTWNFASAGRADPTSHGTSYGYDTRVPVIIAGPGVRPGEYLTEASPLDVAPTLAWLAGVTMAHTDGRVLTEALGTPAHDTPARPTAQAGGEDSGAARARQP